MAGIDEYTKLLLHLDEDPIVDASDYGQTVTKYDGATIVGGGKFDSCLNISSGDGYLIVDDNSHMDVGGGESFTIDFWVKLNSLPGHVWSQQVTGGDYIRILLNTGWFIYQNTNVGFMFIGSIAWEMDRWYHLAVVKDAPGGTYYLFIDGELSNSEGNLDTPVTVGLPHYIGVLHYGSTFAWGLDGYLDEFRFSKGVARWTEAFTPPTGSYTPPPTYEISGEVTCNESDVIIVDESDWTVESTTTKPIGSYSITTTSGNKTVIGRRTDSGRVIAHGNVTPEEI